MIIKVIFLTINRNISMYLLDFVRLFLFSFLSMLFVKIFKLNILILFKTELNRKNQLVTI